MEREKRLTHGEEEVGARAQPRSARKGEDAPVGCESEKVVSADECCMRR